MEEQLIDAISRALRNPDAVLGTGERNTEIKIVFLVLWALGWDPVKDIALGVQIAREKLGADAKSAHAADFLLRDDAGRICIIGEAKHWFVKDKGWDAGVSQILRYLKAVPAPRAFLTCGYKWLIIVTDQSGSHQELIEESDGRKLVERLRRIIGKGHVIDGIDDPSIWPRGISPSRYAAQLRRLTTRSG